MELKGYHHIGLFVKDISKSLAFYRDGMGGKVTFSFPMGDSGEIIYLVDIGGGAVVELIPKGYDQAETNARFAHICIATDDCRAAHALALKAGATERSAPNDGNLGTMSMCNSFVLGPDGESVEFFQEKSR